MLAQGGVNASSASIGVTLGSLPTQPKSPNGAALTFLGPPLRGLTVIFFATQGYATFAPLTSPGYPFLWVASAFRHEHIASLERRALGFAKRDVDALYVCQVNTPMLHIRHSQVRIGFCVQPLIILT